MKSRSQDSNHSGVSWRTPDGWVATLLMLVLALFTSSALAQQLTGTISGTAYDPGGAVIPKASVVLKNEASGDIRTSVTEGDGHFVITGVQPATYTLTITATGFTTWQENAITMNVGDQRAVPNIKLQVGSSGEKVEVIGGRRCDCADRHGRDQHVAEPADDRRFSARQP